MSGGEVAGAGHRGQITEKRKIAGLCSSVVNAAVAPKCTAQGLSAALVVNCFAGREDFTRHVGASGARPGAERRSALQIWLRLRRVVALAFRALLSCKDIPPVRDCLCVLGVEKRLNTEITEMLRALGVKA
jgi:hypothetical protein